MTDEEIVRQAQADHAVMRNGYDDAVSLICHRLETAASRIRRIEVRADADHYGPVYDYRASTREIVAEVASLTSTMALESLLRITDDAQDRADNHHEALRAKAYREAEEAHPCATTPAEPLPDSPAWRHPAVGGMRDHGDRDTW